MSTKLGDLAVSAGMREELLLAGTVVSKAKGTILFRHGDAVAGVFLICRGSVRLGLDGVHQAFPPRVLGAGCVVGLPASVAGSPYSLTAEVTEDADLVFVPRQVLLDSLKQNPHLCFEVMDILSGEISGTRSALKGEGLSRPRKS